jgi:uncharacterized membrane protein YbaN (DUF454 family)
MKKVFENKHLVSTAAKVIMYCTTLVVVGILFLKAPEYAVQVMNAAVYMAGGAAVGAKLGINVK